MNVQGINYITPKVSYRAQKSKGVKTNDPMKSSLGTAGAWFGFGVGLDFLSRKCQFSKSPLKNSLALNGIIASGAGIYTGYQALKKKPVNQE